MMLNQMLITAVIVAVFALYAALSLTAYRLIRQVCTRFLDMIEKLEHEDKYAAGAVCGYAYSPFSVHGF